MRCARCGNENPVTNRYCGMCGASLVATQAGPPSKPPTAAGPASTAFDAAKATSAPRPAAVSSEAAPMISGPSILGLNQPATPGRESSLSIDPNARPGARDLTYLLEDDEQPRGRAGKIVLIVVALGLAVGFGYLRWRNQALPWVGSHAAKPSAAPQGAEATDTSSAPSSPAAAAPGTSQPSATTTPNPPDTSGATPSSASASAGTLPGTSAPGPSPVATSAPNPAATPTQSSATPGAGAAGGGASSSAPTAQPSAATPDTASVPTAAAQLTPAPPPKPRAAVDPVSEAQKYIYGKGVRQDCDRGLRLLKPAADQENPKAMIEMGALYSAGLCTPRDLPTSYRWFAMALRKDPNNQPLQADLQKLWGEMTQPERQLAIRLSQ